MSSSKILVVDDDPSIGRLVATVLTREHYEVDTASGGREAISKIEQGRFDVVVLDLMMPEVNGQDVLQWLYVHAPHLKCVVIMSAATRVQISDALTANVYAIVAKPFELQHLRDTIGACISKSPPPTRTAA